MNVPRDVRYGLRRLNNNAAFTLVAIGCLALGICASITVFSVVNALLLRPLPGVVEPDRLVSLMTRPVPVGETVMDSPLSLPVFLRYAEARAFSGLTASREVPINLVIAGEPFRVAGQVVTDNYFKVLGLRPELGRFLMPGEAKREGPPGVVISHDLLQRSFGGRAALGAVVTLNGHLFVVAGVAPPRFRGPQHQDEIDVWLPLETAPLVLPYVKAPDLNDPEKPWLFSFFGRLAPKADLAQAQRELDLLADQVGSSFPANRRPPGLLVYRDVRIRPGTHGEVSSPLAVLAIVVGLLMLVVCANLGGLLLVKAAARQEEIGVRLALGVTRGQLVRQLLTESVTLSLAGGTVGFVLSLWTAEALQGVSLGRFLPRMRDLSVDGRVVAFTLAVSLGAGFLFGLIPALWATRRRAVPLLHRGGGDNGGIDRGRSRLQEVFVISQVMVSLLLLVITGLFVRTLVNLRSIDPGFRSADILNFRIDLDLLETYSQATGRLFYERLLAYTRALPNVDSASLVSAVPLAKAGGLSRVTKLRLGAADRGGETASEFSTTVPGYFRMLGIPLQRGRDFTDRDGRGGQRVLIVNDELAHRLWPGKEAIGQRVDVGQGGRYVSHEVIGVVRAVRLRRLEERLNPYFYLPLAQRYEAAMTLHVRAVGDPVAAVGAVRTILRRLDPSVGVEVSRYEDEVAEASSQPRLLSWLLGSFSLTALLVTALGLYGTLAYAVRRRTRELGIRIALGARGVEIVAMVLWRGLAMTISGLVLGLGASTWATSIFSSLLFGVTPTDPAVFVSVAILLTLVGLAASSLPAYSATRVDPMGVIRHE